jgi:hypothetical protein
MTKKTLAPELAAHAPAIKAAREAGEAWWRIAHTLGLPGSAETVAKGKAGAGLARRIYAAAFGALPARPVSERTAKKRSEKNENVKAIKATKKEDRVEKVLTGRDSVIPSDLPDEEVVTMLRGREISWMNNLNDLDGKGDSWSEETALVHPKWAAIEITADGHRCLKFKVRDLGVPIEFRLEPGATRIVRLDRIHSVK